MKEDDPKSPKPKIPGWAWIFVVGCVGIPIISLGGAVPGAIGGGGAYCCVAIAREPDKPVGLRIGICVAITAVCWLLFGGFVAFMVSRQMGAGQ